MARVPSDLPPNATAVSRRFDARAAEYDQQSMWVADQSVIDAVLADLPARATILEVAGGTGAVSAAAFARGHPVVCADLSEGMLEQARAKGLPTRMADMHALPFADGEFDIVIVRQAMQYANVGAALREFARVARLSVRIAQIVAEDLEQQSLWQSLFGLLGQTGRKVFLAGEMQEALQSTGMQLRYNVAHYGHDRLISPNSTGIQLDTGAIDRLMLRIAPDATRVGDDWIHRVRWEIVGWSSAATEAVPPAPL